jgi:hypothetical protein
LRLAAIAIVKEEDFPRTSTICAAVGYNKGLASRCRSADFCDASSRVSGRCTFINDRRITGSRD